MKQSTRRKKSLKAVLQKEKQSKMAKRAARTKKRVHRAREEARPTPRQARKFSLLAAGAVALVAGGTWAFLALTPHLPPTAVGVKPVDSEDHIRGDPAAPVKLVEFGDFECPFCKRYHRTLMRVMDEYGKDGRVAWVYRHFPLYPKGRKEAQAAECANELGGNDAFWAFADRLFEVAPSNNRLDLALLPRIADEIGLDRAKFEACLGGDARGGKYAGHIEADLQDAVTSGGNGTPFSLVIAPNGKAFPINGAQPYAAVRSIIELALKEE